MDACQPSPFAERFPYSTLKRPLDIVRFTRDFCHLDRITHAGSNTCQESDMKLNIIIEKDETGYYVAEVPALPGCLSQGKTRQAAIRNIHEAIEGWMEVMESKRHIQKNKLVSVQV